MGLVAVGGLAVFAIIAMVLMIKFMPEKKLPDSEIEHTVASEETILSVLEKYDPDGYFLVDTGIKNGDDVGEYYDHAFELTASIIDTVVHEEFHMFTKDGNDNEERMYMNKDDYVIVPFTETYNTIEMAESVPENCRTIRYSNYISEPSDELAANRYGAYGLLNEFCAYYWGMNNDMALLPWYESQNNTAGEWEIWISLTESNKLAYAEFKYYILHYLKYAKENYPEVYNGIMANEEFKRVYNETEGRFAEDIAAYEEKLKDLKKVLSGIGIIVKYNENEVFEVRKLWEEVPTSIELHGDMYLPLMEELDKPEYKEIEDALK